MDSHTLDAFDRAFFSLLQAERSHRRSLQAEVATLRGLLLEAVMSLSSALVDERIAADPRFLHTLDEAGWRELLAEARRRGQMQRLARSNPKLMAEHRRLLQAHDRLRAERDALQARIETLEAEMNDLRRQLLAAQVVRPEVLLPGNVQLPALPVDPPPAFASLFPGNLWERGRQLLALLALTGWSYQRAPLDELARLLGVSEGAGSLKRLLNRLADAGLVIKATVPASPSRIALARLSDEGRKLVEALGLPAVESEWDRLLRLHGGERQQGHAALVCLFAWHARRRGYATQVCPHVAGHAEPDILLTKENEQIYVEVEAESGSVERRMRKWRNQAAMQGYVALAAPTPELRQRLAREAHAASKKGLATDLTSLRSSDELWIQKW